MYKEEENITLCYLRVTALVLAAKSRAEAERLHQQASEWTKEAKTGEQKLKNG